MSRNLPKISRYVVHIETWSGDRGRFWSEARKSCSSSLWEQSMDLDCIILLHQSFIVHCFKDRKSWPKVLMVFEIDLSSLNLCWLRWIDRSRACCLSSQLCPFPTRRCWEHGCYIETTQIRHCHAAALQTQNCRTQKGWQQLWKGAGLAGTTSRVAVDSQGKLEISRAKWHRTSASTQWHCPSAHLRKHLLQWWIREAIWCGWIACLVSSASISLMVPRSIPAYRPHTYPPPASTTLARYANHTSSSTSFHTQRTCFH
jgi:hypothetical protein